MADINSVNIAGRLTRDSDLRYSNSGLCILRFSVAVNTVRKDSTGEWREEVNYFDITLFGKRAESLQGYLAKGRCVAVTGELRQERWENDGQSRSRVSILANNVMLLGGGSGSSLGGVVSKNNVENTITKSSVGKDATESDVSSSFAVKGSDLDSDDFGDDIPF